MRKGERNPFFGHHHTAEFKEKLSQRTKEMNAKRQYTLQPQKAHPENVSLVYLAYLAGFCDADGSIRFINSRGSKRPFIAFYNSNETVVEWIKTTLGSGSIQKHNKGRELVQSVRYDAARDVWSIVVALRPFLIVKARDADEVIKFLWNKYGQLLARKESI